jgi:hypothetical protein
MEKCAAQGYEDLRSKLQDFPSNSTVRPPGFITGVKNGDGTQNVKIGCGERECGWVWYGQVLGYDIAAVVRIVEPHRRSRHGIIA